MTTLYSRLFAQEWVCVRSAHRKKGWCCVVQLLGSVHFSHCSSPRLLQSALFSSINLLFPFVSLPTSPTLAPSVSLSRILGDPHFTIVAPPLLSLWPLLYAKQVSARTRRTATTSQRRRQGLQGKKHTLTYTPMCSPFLCPLLCALDLHALHTYMLPFFTHTFTQTRIKLPWAGLGLGTGRAGAVCLSVISIPAGGSWPGQTSEWSSRSR